MHMSGPSGDGWCWKKARLNVLVGSIRHNILSSTSLADSGWRFTQGPKGFDLFHEKLGMHCLDVVYFANCPWVRLYPDVGSIPSGHGGSGRNGTNTGSLPCRLSHPASDTRVPRYQLSHEDDYCQHQATGPN